MRKKNSETHLIPFDIFYGYRIDNEPKEIAYYEFLHKITSVNTQHEYKPIQNVSCCERTLRSLATQMPRQVKFIKSVKKCTKPKGRLGSWRVVVDETVPFQKLKLNLRAEVPNDDMFEHGDPEPDYQYY